MEEIKLKLKQLVDSDDEINWKLVCEMVKGFDYDIKMYVRSLFIAKSRELFWNNYRSFNSMSTLDDPTIPYLIELNEYVLTKMLKNER